MKDFYTTKLALVPYLPAQYPNIVAEVKRVIYLGARAVYPVLIPLIRSEDGAEH